MRYGIFALILAVTLGGCATDGSSPLANVGNAMLNAAAGQGSSAASSSVGRAMAGQNGAVGAVVQAGADAAIDDTASGATRAISQPRY